MTELLTVPVGAGVPHASATHGRSTDGETALALRSDYRESEHLISGLARTFSGPAIGPATVASSGTRYITRIVVRRPNDPARFSGRVVIEPFNTSGGADRDVVWARVSALLQAQGDVWIGVTHRASSTLHLKEYDAERYADVDIPSNDVAWDVVLQLGSLLKGGWETSPLRDLDVAYIYLAGYSQSGADTATFAMAIGPIARARDGSPIYDGYFPAGHSASLTPLASGQSSLPRFEYGPTGAIDVPVVEIETQTDVEGFSAELSSGALHTTTGSAFVRRDDSDLPHDRYRLYEIAGAPHTARRPGCDGPGSSFPTSAFMRAALVNLFRWVEDGVAPPSAPRIELSIFDTVSQAAVDQFGNALGGVRSPFLVVPLARFDVHSTPGPLCKLVGRETILPERVLTNRYGDVATYMSRFTASLDATIGAGFLLQSDRAQILASETAKANRAFASIHA